jgi:small subunit ribosomal protein S10e
VSNPFSTLPQLPKFIQLAQHDYHQTKQAHHLREPLQGWVIGIQALRWLSRAHYQLISEGVLVAKKDYNAPKHEELDVPNLQVIKAMQSLTSRGFVKTQFSWQWYYYVLTPEGVEYLREWCVVTLCSIYPDSRTDRLHLPNEIVPSTHKRAARPPRPATVRPGGGDGAYRAPRGDRDDYRKKEGGAPGDYRPSFAGVGRGAPRE